ncbi:MAG TPA: glycosyltransferase family 2 protein, partial [Chromatiaceae bacterium]|nr:glycosyltransferase family 2 protein [Chromatiaceae bacterium]
MDYEELENQRRKAWSNQSPSPGVTCICTTGGRFQYICEAIHQFLSQDYSQKKLLIFNNGSMPLSLSLSLKAQGVLLVNAGDKFKTWGEVLNSAVSLVDTEYVAHWDDDDIYLPNHLSTGIRDL